MNVEAITDAWMEELEAGLRDAFSALDRREERLTEKILGIFAGEQVALRHFSPTNGYGYDDQGRDTLERIYAKLFGAEAAIVRPQIASGTHALSLCLFGLLRPGDHLLSATEKPYDTLDEVIGIAGDAPGSLREMGVSFSSVPMKADGIDIPAVLAAIRPETRVITTQRSRGYALRPSVTPEEMAPLFRAVRAVRPDIFLMVDNCYGEFVCDEEPIACGADVMAGSLIKNIGGGLAPTGGYIVGSQRAIERVESRLTAPGIGREVGSYAGSYRPFYQGLFMAPHTVKEALKVSMLTAAAFERLGFRTVPGSLAPRADIIQAIQLETPERMVAYCQAIQAASPVDSHAAPEPWDMPGYQDPVIMAAGTFVAGASIELSADGPMRPPYAVYQQGGLTYAHGKIALRRALQSLMKQEEEKTA